MARPRKTDAPDLTQTHDITAGAIDRLICPPGKTQAFMRDVKAPGLRVRVTAAGAKSFVFEAKLHRQTIRRTIGDVRAWSIEAARTEANRLRVTLDAGIDPRQQDADKAAEKAATAEAKRQAAVNTLENLLTDYCDYLESLGRRSHSDARSIFRLHVSEAWPKVATAPAKDVSPEQFADMARKLFEAGKGRTGNKLRSYARAAYQVAKAAKSKPSIPLSFKVYGITTNPVAETSPDESQNRADKNPMSAAELRVYWHVIKPMVGLKGALLRLHLLTGGQRIAQLVRLKCVDLDDNTIVLYDAKGRPGHPPRPHTVPLAKEARRALMECRPVGTYALSTDGGATHIAATTLSNWAVEVAGDAIEDFQAKRVRSGVETLLASVRVSSEIRGRVQSHGISGVQNRHYDGHDYLTVKRKALETLHKLLEQRETSKVSSIAKHAA